MPDLTAKVRKFIAQHSLLLPGARVLVAVSGGPDSVALLRTLHELGYDVGVAHVHFGLRPEADAEVDFVQQISKELGCPCYVHRVDASADAAKTGASVQMAARRLRYDFFTELLEEHGYTACATAHHSDDQVENLLMSLFRGGSFALLKPIPLRRETFVRPFLGVSRQEILAWLQQHGHHYYTDASNADPKYLRNLVRHEVIPALEHLNPDLKDRTLQLGERYERQMGVLEGFLEEKRKEVERRRGENFELDLKKLKEKLDRDGVEVFVEYWLGKRGMKGNESREALKLIDADVGKTADGSTVEVLRDRDKLILRPRIPYSENTRSKHVSLPHTALQSAWSQAGGAEYNLGALRLQFEVLTMPAGGLASLSGDADEANVAEQHLLAVEALRFPLRLRRWEQGDRMRPLGLNGSKLLSDIFAGQKLDRFAKEAAVVLEDAEGILLLSGYRIAERGKLKKDSTQYLRIRIWDATAI